MSKKGKVAMMSSLSLFLGGAVWFGMYKAAAAETTTTQPAAEEQPVASVTTAPLRMDQIAENITAYGTVVAQPGEVTIVSAPLECLVLHVSTVPGQQVDKDSPLIEIALSSDAKLQLIEARNALAAANQDLEQTHRRFDMKLATNQELQTSERNLQTAKVHLDNLLQRGAAESSKKLTADKTGLVNKIDVQEGQIVPAGGPLVELISDNKIEVKLGVEPSDIDRVLIGQSVSLASISDSSARPLRGKVRLITHRLNPDTRLIDVFISLDSHEMPLLDSSIRAELISPPKQAMVVPRQAVLPDDDGFALFTVKDNHAIRHAVRIGLHNDRDVEVMGDGLIAGDPAVVLGNLELDDGMPVSAETAK